MRNPDRLDNFYEELKNIHKKYASDWRFGQLMVNVLSSLPIDPFFPEEDKMLEYFKDFFNKEKQKEK